MMNSYTMIVENSNCATIKQKSNTNRPETGSDVGFNSTFGFVGDLFALLACRRARHFAKYESPDS